MTIFTLDELCTIMGQAGGDRLPAGEDVAAVPYPDLGFDSLALLEILTRVERSLGVRIPEDTVLRTHTPGETVDAVNALLSELAGV